MSAKKRGLVVYVKEKWEPTLICKDEEGRILGVQINHQGEKFNVITVYAPNTKKAEFFKKLEQMLLELESHKLILLGDLNGVPDPEMDRSEKKRKTNQGKLPKSFKDLQENLDLIDIWRYKNPTIRQFTHFSDVHQSWGRIDQIWISRELSLRTRKCEIEPRTLSDHNPIILEIKSRSLGQYRWRMNEYLLENEEIIEKAKNTLKEYFEWNLNKGTKIDIVWEASKAVLRGFLIQQNSYRRKLRELKKEEIVKQLKECEEKLIINPEDEKMKQIAKVLQTQYSTLLGQEVEWRIKSMKQKYFESANKTGRLLAWQLRKRKKQMVINKIKIEEHIIEDPNEIKEKFLQFYETLYKRKEDEDTIEIERYLEKNGGERLTDDEKSHLNKPITTDEVKEAIKKMKPGKAPGPDGLSQKYYKVLEEYVTPVLCDVFNNILQGGRIPDSWREAHITLIPKPEADKLDVKNYRPISLLNNDYKIFAEIMAKRLKKYLIKSIHKDQAGFLPGRQLKDNIRNIINIIEYLEFKNEIPAALVFVDAEKAFDNVSWCFLVKCMERVGIEGPFLEGIKAIYSSQRAKLIINNNLTDSFMISKGTRQGCPLSPLLFIMVLEIIANKIRETPEIRGIKLGVKEYKLKAYADDLVISLEEPLKSVEKVLEVLEEFGKLSGFKLNKNKTKILTKNLAEDLRNQLEQQTGIKVVKKVKYLGIWVTTKNINLVENNYKKTWSEIKKDLDIWSRLTLSWEGRMAAIKMNILPKILFLFQNIPVIRGTTMFKEWQRTLSRFIWQGKRARIKFKLLTDRRERGGFAVPNLQLYYEAACLCWVKDWIVLENLDVLDLEGFDARFGWHAYLWQDKERVHKGFSHHIVRGALLEVWNRTKRLLEKGIPWWLSPVNISSLKNLNTRSQRWTYEDLLTKSDKGWRIKSFEELKDKSIGWLQVHQINALWNEHKKIGMNEKKSKFQVEILEGKSKLLSKMYNQLLEWDTKDEEVKEVMIKWAIDLGYSLEYERWVKLWTKDMKFTACVSLRENMEKMMYRWHITPVKLGKMYKTGDKRCWKCKKKEGDFHHMWWSCEEVKRFWGSIYDELKKILKYTFPKKPEAFLLGMVGEEIRKEDQTMFQYATTAARLLLAQNWKSSKIPTISEWQNKLFEYSELAKMTQKIRHQSNKIFINDWNKFISYMEKNLGNIKITVGEL
uniref:Reverse transcriptase domain-containing protein n=1 Tax=Podarcis muralis TaxID=64176 RepID=A0A670HXR6_PODMU